jgi:hypothetical protein
MRRGCPPRASQAPRAHATTWRVLAAKEEMEDDGRRETI